MIEKWKVLKSETVYQSPFITLLKEDLQRSDGKVIKDFFSVSRRDSVFVVALTPDKKVVLVSQYKNGVKDVIWELPAGFIDDNEEPLAAANRELSEETGFVAKESKYLGSFLPNTGVSPNKSHIFLLLNCEKKVETKFDDQEEIETGLYDLDELLLGIKNRKSIFIDMQSQLSLLLAEQELLR